MKKLLFLSFVISSVISLNAQINLFQQDFSASTTVADYISATTPNSGQFDAMSADVVSAFTKSITNGALRFSKTASSSFYVYRNFSATSTFVQLKLDFEATNVGAITTNPNLSIIIGSGFSSASVGSTSNFASRFGFKPGIGTDALIAYTIDNIGGSPGSASFTGKQTLTFVVNNSGVSQTYTAPNATTESVATGKMDLWVGNSKGINDFSLKNTDGKGAISGFKIQSGIAASGNGTFDFDNIEFTDLLAVATQNSIVKSISNLNVYPNPVVGVTEIRNLPVSVESIKLDLYNISSQLVESKVYNVNNGVVKIDMTNKAKGTYFVKSIADEPFMLKLIKK